MLNNYLKFTKERYAMVECPSQKDWTKGLNALNLKFVRGGEKTAMSRGDLWGPLSPWTVETSLMWWEAWIPPFTQVLAEGCLLNPFHKLSLISHATLPPLSYLFWLYPGGTSPLPQLFFHIFPELTGNRASACHCDLNDSLENNYSGLWNGILQFWGWFMWKTKNKTSLGRRIQMSPTEFQTYVPMLGRTWESPSLFQPQTLEKSTYLLVQPIKKLCSS